MIERYCLIGGKITNIDLDHHLTIKLNTTINQRHPEELIQHF